MKYCILTYGCQMNEADSRLMAGLLQEAGWHQCGHPEEADLVILNTCSVREKPERKVYGRLGDLRRHKQRRPNMVIAVAGCMAQREGARIVDQADHVDVVLGTRSFHRIHELAERARSGERPVLELGMDGDPSAARGSLAASQTSAPLRAFVPVIRGCSNFCSYCIVPHVRGSEVSRPLGGIVAEVQSLVEAGTREVTLLGQNVLAYGRDLPDRPTFPALLRELAGIADLWRIRFTTCHPRDVTPDLISAMASLPSVCEHIHLPIQAGTDSLLREMNRGYTTGQYLELIAELRSDVPGIAITTDIMVGFPGETEEEFEQSLDLYEQIAFDAAFTFAYSPRPGTAAAARGDQVPQETRIARLQRLIALQNSITVSRNEAQVGRVLEVLVDGPAQRGVGLLAGRARSNRQVIFPGPSGLTGTLASVRATTARLWGVHGERA
jgi:tRNA-2-methylthio-N6-dimethylallyladenosine synthase